MSSTPLAAYIIGDAQRQELAARFLDIVRGAPSYYRNFLHDHYLSIPYHKQALDKLKPSLSGNTKQAMQDQMVVKGAKLTPAPTDAEFAAFAAWVAHRFIPTALGKTTDQPKLEAPIVMLEQTSGQEMYFYRVFGGNGKAKSDGNWWMDETDLIEMVVSARRYGARSGMMDWQVKALTREFMLTSAYVYHEWNDGLRVARMTVPAGMRLPVIVAKGSWRTLAEAARPDKAALKAGVPDKASDVAKQNRVFRAGMLPRSGLKQWYIPVFNKNWIVDVPNAGANWPFGRDMKGRLDV